MYIYYEQINGIELNILVLVSQRTYHHSKTNLNLFIIIIIIIIIIIKLNFLCNKYTVKCDDINLLKKKKN